MKAKTLQSRLVGPTHILTLALGFLCAGAGGTLRAQAPRPGLEPFATGLLAPSKIIQTPRGNFIVAEGRLPVPNNGRVSIVDQHLNRRTMLDGLPSARTFVGDFNGTTGVYLEGWTLFILTDCLTTSSSMVLDQWGHRLVIAELATAWLVTFELPRSVRFLSATGFPAGGGICLPQLFGESLGDSSFTRN
jgi:hypothetical protein